MVKQASGRGIEVVIDEEMHEEVMMLNDDRIDRLQIQEDILTRGVLQKHPVGVCHECGSLPYSQSVNTVVI